MANSETQHEMRDAPPSIPAYVILFMVIFVTLSAFGVWGLVNIAWRAPPPRPTPFAAEAPPGGTAPPPVSPAPPPRLQLNPEADLAALHRRMEERLHDVGWVNRGAGIVYMPIDRAMDLLVKRGSPDAAFDAMRSYELPARLAQEAGHSGENVPIESSRK